MEKNTEVTIPSAFKKCEETGRIDNFRIAGKLEKGAFKSVFPFDDSDVYKIIEGASYSLLLSPDPALEAYLDTLISYIAAAQQSDGYLQTWRIIDPGKPPTEWSGNEERWSDIQSGHELYNMGHFYEAAVAFYHATGKRSMLDLAIRNADLIADTFGPGKIVAVPGHPEIEIGLVKLYRATGNVAYLDLARFFIDHRGVKEGRKALYGNYAQDDTPILSQSEAEGHAVRAAYLYSGMADVSAISGDTAYMNALQRIWNNVVTKKIYITGGIGARRDGERFGDNYELPNFTAYNETCAAIANIIWNYRMFLMSGDGKYMDVLERTLYNGMLAGVSFSGDSYFYPNPLASDGKETFNMGSCTRSAWFDCSCCPSNVSRFIPSIPGYVYASQKDRLFINLFIGNHATIDMQGNTVSVTQETGYPWKNTVRIEISPDRPGQFDLNVRIPGWARGEVIPGDLYRFNDKESGKAVIKINGKETSYGLSLGYAVLSRKWEKGDIVELSLPMEVRRVSASEKVAEDRGRVAVECGPLVYCAEETDNTADVLEATIPGSSVFTREFRDILPGGVMVITTKGVSSGKDGLTMIPYYAWSNRGPGKMAVWFLDKEKGER